MSNAHTHLLKSRIDVHPVTRSQLLSKSWLVTNYQDSRTVCLIGVSAYQARASYVSSSSVHRRRSHCAVATATGRAPPPSPPAQRRRLRCRQSAAAIAARTA
eukprot:4772552-Pleurochrysis_carterae.AAC.1